ncbi:hypothetical protein FF38_01763, partial [Lucilia cuprina]
ISKLLATKKQNKPKIEVVDSNDADGDGELSDSDIEIEQTEFNQLTNKTSYGFNNLYFDRIGLSQHLGNEINELEDPETGDSGSRLAEMHQKVTDFFDADYYLADHFDNEMINETLNFNFPTTIELEFDINDQLIKLGNREFLISDLKPIYLG